MISNWSMTQIYLSLAAGGDEYYASTELSSECHAPCLWISFL